MPDYGNTWKDYFLSIKLSLISSSDVVGSQYIVCWGGSCPSKVLRHRKKICLKGQSNFIFTAKMCVFAAKIYISAGKMYIFAAKMKKVRHRT